MQIMNLDCVHDAVYNSTNHTYTFPWNIYNGLKLCDVCVGKIPIESGTLSGTAGVIVSNTSPYSITVSAGSGAGTYIVTAANPNVLTLSV